MVIPELIDYVIEKPLQCQNLQRLSGHAEQAFQVKQYNEAINDLTDAINEINRNLLANILLKRAVVQGVHGSPEAGLADAYKVIELLPELPEGYLCAGGLLRSMHENSAAVRIYTIGLKNVSSKGAGYSQLVRSKSFLENEIDCNNTILLRKLPLELLGSIFASSLLSVRDRIQCAATCRAWRSFLLDEVPRLWREIEFVDMPENVMVRQLASAGSSQIRKVRLKFTGRNKKALTEKVLTLLIEHQYTFIESLELRSEVNENDRHLISILRQLFMQNKHSLRSVTVYCRSFRLAMIAMDCCPNLTSLVSKAPALGFHNSTFTSETLYTPLSSSNEVFQLHFRRHMALMRARQEEIRINARVPANTDAFTLAVSILRSSELYQAMNIGAELKTHGSLARLELSGLQISYFGQPFWRRLPHLEELVIEDPLDMPGDFEALVKVLNEFCPKLKTFRFGGICGDPLLTLSNDEKKLQGLVEVTMRGWSSVQSEINAITTLVQKSRDTLKMLRLPMEVLALPGSNVLSNLQIPHLRHLSIYGDAYRALDPSHCASLVRNCPKIETVIIKLPITTEGLLELSKATELRSFCLVDPAQSINNGGTGLTPADITEIRATSSQLLRTSFRRFFENCNLLTEICFCGPLISDGDLVSLATNTPHLTSLKLLFSSSSALTARGLISFAACAPERLKNLALMDLKCLDDECLIRLLVDLPALETTILAMCPPWMNNRRHIRNCLEQVMGLRSLKTKSHLQVTFAPAPGTQLLLNCIPGKAITENLLTGPSVFRVLLNIY
ncbi:hypothetical protein BJV82DRAFT_22343 [Fennellomyces sp. T-0311]|nr:hypothetical protein BJV82DRAFT_22343 [Fennellomyces sp. T-0311]